MKQPVCIKDPGEIEKFRASRFDIIKVPSHFKVESKLSRPGRFTVSEPVTIEGMATFENKPMKVVISSQKDNRPAFSTDGQTILLNSKDLVHGTHNIQLGPVQIIEHPIAMMLALNLDLDFNISVPSFPTFDRCDATMIEAILPYVTSSQQLLKPFTVREPFALQFETGYCILLPSWEGLTIDHQVEYPGFIGRQRVVEMITSDFFQFLCAARTPSVRSATETDQILAAIKTGQFPMPFTLDNVLVADENGYRNPRKEFEHEGHNFEFILHELIDEMAWLKILECDFGGKFHGHMITHRFGHAEQIMAASFCGSDQHRDYFRFKA